jgi:hypothetical protein
MEDMAISQEFHQVHLVDKELELLELLQMQPGEWILLFVSVVERYGQSRAHRDH